MSSDKLTRCPHCKAAFKVSEEQLEVANGRVRCGACMNVFDALAYSLGEANGSAATETNEEAPNSSAIAETDKETPSSIDSTELEDELIQDDPEEDQDAGDYRNTNRLEDEFSTSFMEIDKQSNSGSQFGEVVEDFDDTPDDESWAKSMLEEESRVEQETRTEPQISDSPLDEFEPPEFESSTAYEFNETPRSSGPQDNEHISFYYDSDDGDAPKRHWLASGALITVNVTLIVVLLALASWFHYEKLVKYPQIAQLYTQACDLLGCTLPELSDVTKIKSHNLIVRSHPTTRDALIIDTVITNQADFAQDFPNLAIYFSDINNQTIAQRLIEPKQYLSPEILAWGEMPSDEPIHISLEIVDPGKEAVNYTLKFFPPKPENGAS